MLNVRALGGRAALLLGLLAIGAALFAADAPGAAATSPPDAVGSVSVSRADGTLTASWSAPAGATSYHVTYSTDGMTSWSLAAFSHGSTSITIGADNAKTYVVGVRARGTGPDDWSAWTNSAAAGPYTPPAPPPPPAAVSAVSVTRADGTLTASWDAPSGATKYHVTWSDDHMQSWTSAADAHASTSITISADNAEAYHVAVRAGNDGGWSGWTNSPIAYSFFPPERGIRIQDADGNAITALAVPEGGEASYQVVLTAAPTETTKVCVYISVRDKNDPDITFKGEAADIVSIDVIFTPDNWNVPQTVTLVAAEDDDYANGARDSGLDARKYYNGKVDLAVTEIDNDAPPAPAAIAVERADGTLSVSGYAVEGASEYHIVYSSDGKASWTAAASPGDGHSAPGITISGADNDAAYHVAVRAGADGGWSAWTISAAAGPWDPPPAPTGLSVAPNGDSLDITWTASEGATGYDVRAKVQNATEWTTVADNVAGTSHQYTTSQTIDYVAVRARNAGGTSDWAQISRQPPSDLLNTATGISGGGVQGASVASGLVMAMGEGVSAQSNDVSAQAQLAAPVWGTITRNNNRLRGELNLNWTHSGWATGYNIVCSDTDGWSWNVCGWVDSTERAVYTTVPSSQSKPIKVTHYRRGSGSYGTPGDYALWRWRHYTVAIRAVNANPADASPWVNSEIIRPISGQLSNLTYTRTATSITLSWDPNYWTTGYTIKCGAYDSTQDPYVPPATTCATLTNQDDTAASHTVTLTSWTGGSINNTSTWDIEIVSTNKWGSDAMYAPLIAPLTLSASSSSATGATLTIGGHVAQWWYKADTGPDSTCKGPVAANTATKNLTGLSGATSYVYTAYSASGCASANLLATAAAFTTPVSVSNLSETVAGLFTVGSNAAYAQEFTTGPNTGGYTLSSVTVDFTLVTDASAVTVAIHDSAIELSTTLTGTAATGQAEFTCSSNCELDADTSYFVHVSASSAHLTNTESDAETLTPSGNGWSIADAARDQSDNWGNSSGKSMLIKVTATPKPSLASSSVTATGATLTIGGHTGAWWYKSATTGKTTCTSAGSVTSVNVTGLTASTAYVFTAYSDSGCSTSVAAAPSFTTPLASPTGVVASASKGGVSVTWTATGVDKAQVRTRTSAVGGNSAGAWSAAVDPVRDADASPARIIGLTAGTAYDAQLRTVKGTNQSAWVSGGTSITPSATTAPSGKATNVSVNYADNKIWIRFDFPSNLDDGGLALDYQFSGNTGGNNINGTGTGLDIKVGSEADKTHGGTTYDVVYYFDRWQHPNVFSNQWQSICVSGRNFHVTRVNILIKNTLGNSGWHNVDLSPHVHSGCD